MPLPSSGSISLNQMHVEVGGTSGTQVSMNDSDVRGLISKASAAQSSFSEFYGASAVTALASGTGTTGIYNRGTYNPGYWGYQKPTSTGSLSLTNGSFAAAFGSGCTDVSIYNEIPGTITGSSVIAYEINPIGIGAPTVSWTSIKIVVGGNTYTTNRTTFATSYYGAVGSFYYYLYVNTPFHNLASGTSFTWEIS